MERIPKELKEKPLPLVCVNVLPGCGEPFTAASIVSKMMRKNTVSGLRVLELSEDSIQTTKDHRRTEYGGNGNDGTPQGTGAGGATGAVSGSEISVPGAPVLPSYMASSVISLYDDMKQYSSDVQEAGILRKNWFRKVLYEVPSVIVTFFTFGTPEEWRDKENQLYGFVCRVRNAAKYRGIQLLFVSVYNDEKQRTQSLGNDERIASLRKRADLDARQFFQVLRVPELFFVDNIKVVSDAYTSHYEDEVKRYKKLLRSAGKIPFLAKKSIQLSIKQGFMNQIINKLSDATKCYDEALSKLSDMAASEMRRGVESLLLHEVKCVAWIVTFMQCFLNLTYRNAYTNAVQQFAVFYRNYRSCDALTAQLFVHKAWMASCYEDFAELIEKKSQIFIGNFGARHPWYYYLQAARFTRERGTMAFDQCSQYGNDAEVLKAKQALLTLRLSVPKSDSPSSVSSASSNNSDDNKGDANGENKEGAEGEEVSRKDDIVPVFAQESKFYGQFSSWRDEKGGLGDDAYRMIAWDLFYMDHTRHAYNLLMKAKTFLSNGDDKALPREQILLKYESVVLFRNSKNWPEAYHLSQEITDFVAQEGWDELAVQTVSVARESAGFLKKGAEFAKLSLELLAGSSETSREFATRIQRDLELFLSPSEDRRRLLAPDTPPNSLQAALCTYSLPEDVIWNIPNSVCRCAYGEHQPLVEVHAAFTQSKVEILSAATVALTVVSHFPLPVTFAALKLQFTDPSCSVSLSHNPASLSLHLRFVPGVPRKLIFTINPQILGTVKPTSFDLYLSSPESSSQLTSKSSAPAAILHWDNIPAPSSVNTDNEVFSSLEVFQQHTFLTVATDCAGPALCSEKIPFHIAVCNTDPQNTISDAVLDVSASPKDHACTITTDPEGNTPYVPTKFPSLPPSSGKSEMILYICCAEPCAFKIRAEVRYTDATKKPCVVAAETPLDVSRPFQASAVPYDRALSHITQSDAFKPTTLPQGERFMLHASISTIVPHALDIHSIDLIPNPSHTAHVGLRLLAGPGCQQLLPVTVTRSCSCACVFQLTSQSFCSCNVSQPPPDTPLGTLSIKYSRHEKPETGELLCELPLFAAMFSPPIYSAKMEMHGPCKTCVGSPVPVVLRLENRSPAFRDFSFKIAPTDAFFVDGEWRGQRSLVAQSFCEIPLEFIPVKPGVHALPTVRVNVNKDVIPVLTGTILVVPRPSS